MVGQSEHGTFPKKTHTACADGISADRALPRAPARIRPVKLIYIGGYGHSGSTLLEGLLAGCSQVLACGEIASAAKFGMRKGSCTCRARTSNCAVWGPLKANLGRRAPYSHYDLVMALLQQAAGYALLTDSSKTAWRSAFAPFRLRWMLQNNFALVHIVRNPEAVCWSMVKKARRKGNDPRLLRLCIFTTFGWAVANLACEVFGRLHPKLYWRVRYENLVQSPEDEVRQLLRALLPEKGGAVNFTFPSQATNRHQLYGNRMRSAMMSFSEVKADRAWETEMPRRYRVLVGILAWPFYRRRSPRPLARPR